MAKKDPRGAFMQVANVLFDVGKALAERIRERRQKRAQEAQKKSKP
jgi:hypothetical protein